MTSHATFMQYLSPIVIRTSLYNMYILCFFLHKKEAPCIFPKGASCKS